MYNSTNSNSLTVHALRHGLPHGRVPLAGAAPAHVELDEPCALALVHPVLEVGRLERDDRVAGVVQSVEAALRVRGGGVGRQQRERGEAQEPERHRLLPPFAHGAGHCIGARARSALVPRRSARVLARAAFHRLMNASDAADDEITAGRAGSDAPVVGARGWDGGTDDGESGMQAVSSFADDAGDARPRARGRYGGWGTAVTVGPGHFLSWARRIVDRLVWRGGSLGM